MSYQKIINELRSLASPSNVEGMARFGIASNNTLGISIPNLRKIAKRIGKDHNLSERLWESGIHEAKILAAFIDIPDRVDAKQMDRWIRDFDSWDVCDQVCSNLFDKTKYAYKKCFDWSNRKREYEKRAGFALMAVLASHDKKMQDADFLKFFPVILKNSTDERNYVRKAVNWALRNIGKRNKNLRKVATKEALEIKKIDSKTARWIANDALRELAP